MPDNSQMMSGAWADILPDLQRHIVENLDPLLPPGLTLLSTGRQITLSASHRVVATTTPGVPPRIDRAGLADVAAHLLDDAQDLVITHLARPWPLTNAGATTHATAELVGASLRIGFATSDATDAIVLEPYVVPEDPPQVVTAG